VSGLQVAFSVTEITEFFPSTLKLFYLEIHQLCSPVLQNLYRLLDHYEIFLCTTLIVKHMYYFLKFISFYTLITIVQCNWFPLFFVFCIYMPYQTVREVLDT
jgi:hypothetical protein